VYIELRKDGKYYLKQEFATDSLLIKRYQATCDNTLMNAGERPRERAAKKHELEETLKSLCQYYERLQHQNASKLSTRNQRINMQYQFQKEKTVLINILQYPNFKQMNRQLLEQFLTENPQFRLILEEEQII
jgi:hypothetical protein